MGIKLNDKNEHIWFCDKCQGEYYRWPFPMYTPVNFDFYKYNSEYTYEVKGFFGKTKKRTIYYPKKMVCENCIAEAVLNNKTF